MRKTSSSALACKEESCEKARNTHLFELEAGRLSARGVHAATCGRSGDAPSPVHACSVAFVFASTRALRHRFVRYRTGWFDDTFPCSVDTNPSDRARSRRAPAFPYIMCTLWMVADHENHTSHRSYPAHEHTRLETHQSDQLTYSNYDNGHGTVRPSMSYEQVPRAAASGGVREARGGSLHSAARAPAS